MRKIFRKSKKGIKICRVRFNDFVSCYENGNSVVYKKNKWVKRPKNCGSLAVFDTLKHAKEFLVINGFTPEQYVGGRLFFTCKYKQSEDVMWNWMRLSGKWMKMMNMCIIPDGTIYADKVKILKKVK